MSLRLNMIRYISLVLSVSFLLLHTLLPHTHHDQFTNNEEHVTAHSSAQNFLDYLKLAFHTNLGVNHLEEYQKAFDVDLSPLQSIELLQTIVFVQMNDKSLTPFTTVISEKHPLQAHRLRGPPKA